MAGAIEDAPGGLQLLMSENMRPHDWTLPSLRMTNEPKKEMISSQICKKKSETEGSGALNGWHDFSL